VEFINATVGIATVYAGEKGSTFRVIGLLEHEAHVEGEALSDGDGREGRSVIAYVLSVLEQGHALNHLGKLDEIISARVARVNVPQGAVNFIDDVEDCEDGCPAMEHVVHEEVVGSQK
jgi:hypothetical protein